MKNILPLRLRFGSFELDLKSGELQKSGKRVVLQDQPFQVLRILIENAGAITTREEIQKQLWPNDTVVEFDHSINAAIKKLRVALGDSADNPKYIETVARRGYRLMVAVERLDSAASDASGTGVVTSSPDGTGVQVQIEAAGLTGKTVSHYRVLEVVGGGGMGVIYKAEDLKLGRAVALKFLPEEVGDDARALERFEREARAASSLDHPNICPVYEFGEHKGRPFIVMQLLQGQTLREGLASGALKDTGGGEEPVALDRLLDIGIQVAQGLEAAHEQGIVHRDIKPANIFLTNKGVAKILDFGLAKLPVRPSAVLAIPAELGGKDSNGVSTVKAVGTAAYMSPEQIRGQQLDARTDLFSFGLVLYEMATGQRAFTGDNAAALREAILTSAPASPAELNSELPSELQDVIQKCLEKDRNLRYQRAAEIRSDLETIRRQTQQSYLRLHWKPIAGAAAVLIALIAGGLYWRSRQARTLTQKDTIVLADFNNTTGDPVFDDALNSALAVEFQQSPFFNLLSPDKQRRALKLMNRPANERLTLKVAREVCQRTDSKAVVAGSISDAGNHYGVELKVVDCHSGKTLANTKLDAANRNEVVKTVGIASADIRSKLGEPRDSLQRFNKPLEEATSSSVDALEAFDESVKRKLQGGDVAANVSYLNRAVELDPNFAQAYVALGIAYLSRDLTLSSQNFRKAYELRGRVTERQRFFIEAMYYHALGQADKSIQVFTEWVKTYPMDFLAHNNLSSALFPVGQYPEAAAEAEESIRLRPSAFAYVNLIASYLGLNRLDDAKAAFDDARALNLTDDNLNSARYIIAFLQDDKSGMREQLTWGMGKPGIEDKLLSAQSDTEAAYGRFLKARPFSQQAVESAKRAGSLQTAATWRVDEALREAEIGNAAQARQLAAEALALSPQWDIEAAAALAFARAGDGVQARKLLEKLHQEYPLDTLMQNYLLPSIGAANDLQENNPAKATDRLKVTQPYDLAAPKGFGFLYPVYLRGQAYLRAGQGQEAAAEFQKLLDHRGIVGNSVLGTLAHLQLGRAQAMMGDKEAARKSYQDFFALWKDADPDIPILHAAKTEYARLKQPFVTTLSEPALGRL